MLSTLSHGQTYKGIKMGNSPKSDLDLANQIANQLSLSAHLGVAAKDAIREARNGLIQKLKENREAWGVTAAEYNEEITSLRNQADLLLDAVDQALSKESVVTPKIGGMINIPSRLRVMRTCGLARYLPAGEYQIRSQFSGEIRFHSAAMRTGAKVSEEDFNGFLSRGQIEVVS